VRSTSEIADCWSRSSVACASSSARDSTLRRDRSLAACRPVRTYVVVIVLRPSLRSWRASTHFTLVGYNSR
jgi:hypothetical protein